MNVAVTQDQLATVRRILRAVVPGAECLAFGSRVAGTHRRHSDLDVSVRAEAALPLAVLSRLEEELAESDLPFSVDVVDWHRAAPAFRRLIEEGGTPI